MQKQAEWLKQYTNVHDHRSKAIATSAARASTTWRSASAAPTAVKQYLVALGVPATRIKTISYGKERPIVVGSDEAAWAPNRVGITVIN